MRIVLSSAIVAVFLLQQGKGFAQGEGIGTLPRSQTFAALQGAPADYDGDGLGDLLEVVTLKTDPNVFNLAAIEISPSSPDYFRLLVWQPLTQTFVLTGEIHVSFLAQLGGSASAQPASSSAASSSTTPGQPAPSSKAKSQPLPSIYRPIEPLPPETVKPNSLCVQETMVVGAVGSSLILEVIEANCEPFDGTCSPNACKATAGSTTEVLDPLALIGG